MCLCYDFDRNSFKTGLVSNEGGKTQFHKNTSLRADWAFVRGCWEHQYKCYGSSVKDSVTSSSECAYLNTSLLMLTLLFQATEEPMVAMKH